MIKDDFVTRIRSELKAALKEFGEYSFFDKGASAIMDIDKFADELRDMAPIEIECHVKDIIKSEPKYGVKLVSELIFQIDNYDHWEELSEEVTKYY